MLDFDIQKDADVSKYLQLANQIIEQIEKGELRLGEKLPSVNKLAKELKISRETVFKALNHLSERGIVYSKNRKGYFVNKIDVQNKIRIFLLLDKFTEFKDKLYHSLFEKIGDKGEVDIFFHHHNYTIFESLIKENLPNYTHFVIVTFMKEDVKPILNLIPPEKRIILDCKEFGLEGHYSMIYQDFSQTMIDALTAAHDRLLNYQRLIMVASETYCHTELIKPGFCQYCREHGFDCEIVEHVDASNFKKESVYITIGADEVDITRVIKLSHQYHYTIGEEIGIISYNETPIKEVLEGGITVISTNFKSMGEEAAKLIINKETKILTNPSEIILRNSL